MEKRKKSGKSVVFSARFTAEEMGWLKEEGEELGESPGYVLRRFVGMIHGLRVEGRPFVLSSLLVGNKNLLAEISGKLERLSVELEKLPKDKVQYEKPAEIPL